MIQLQDDSTSMDVTFLETEHFFTSPSSSSSCQGELISATQDWEYWPGFTDTTMKNAGGDDENMISVREQPHVVIDTEHVVIEDRKSVV